VSGPYTHRGDLLGLFAHHRVAANLLMLIMLLAGAVALQRLNVQFFPSFELDVVNVRVVWSGASPEDVEAGITTPLEQELKTVDGVDELTSTSAQGVAAISLRFKEGTDIILALDDVKQRVDAFRNLPQEAERPEVSRVVRYEPVARLLLTGDLSPRELRALARRFERELLAAGVDRVTFTGLPDEEMAVQVPTATQVRLGMDLPAVAERVAEQSRDLPAGEVGQREAARELRMIEQRRTSEAFAALTLIDGPETRITLGDAALVERRPLPRSATATAGGRPAVELRIWRSEQGHSLHAARLLADWVERTRPTLPPTVELRLYDETWQLIRERIMLLVKNGATGLVLVVAILYVFLNGRVAFWVAVGIPTSFAATLALLYLAGGSINMVSLFALIMALGIIVDDAIVVGEDAYAHYQAGEPALTSAEGGARRMLAPVLASSLTTIAAFLPLMLVGGPIGNILFDIPFVVTAVIVASLLESFLVLPGHLREAFMHIDTNAVPRLRRRLDEGFARFRDGWFRSFVRACLHHRALVLAVAAALLMVSIGLLKGGRLPFTFFPTPEGQVIYANVGMVAGTPRSRTEAFVRELETALAAADEALGGGLVQTAVAVIGTNFQEGTVGGQRGDQLAGMIVELAPPDHRDVRNRRFIEAWRERVRLPAGVENFSITERRSGPPGRDVSIRLTGTDTTRVKEAALALAEALEAMPGVSDVEDDLPYGREQMVVRLTPQARAMGLTAEALGARLRAAFDGRRAEIFQDGADEVEVRVMLPDAERERLAGLLDGMLRVPDGGFVPAATLLDFESRQGFEVIRHAEARLAVEVGAEVDEAVSNANRILEALERDTLPALAARYGVHYSYTGRAEDQQETLGDMKTGLVLGLALIYLVLAWVFGSYGWPLVVMSIIPFGLVGALFGHLVMGLDLTILSLFGLFGLSGIVVNDSIILVSFYKDLRARGLSLDQAIEEASCQRLRAVLLTSLTTIAGLTPLLFERSLQAQFLVPMATSIAFGLMASTLLVLIVVPVLLHAFERLAARLGWAEAAGATRPAQAANGR
jgi:multidrug efflux pump subunit AcrB